MFARTIGQVAIVTALAAVACSGDVTTSGGGTDGGANSADTTDLEFCVEETNRLRAMHGKPALEHSSELEAYANEGAQADTQSGSAHGHFSATSGGGIAFAENECPSFLGWRVMGDVRNTIRECIAAFYSEGPGGGHYDNMMGNYGSLGCGVYVQGDGITIVQDFGR